MSNADQLDADGDGRGDACPALATIVDPALSPNLFVGDTSSLTAALTARGVEAGGFASIGLTWSVDGQPVGTKVSGAVTFGVAGAYTLTLTATHVDTQDNDEF